MFGVIADGTSAFGVAATVWIVLAILAAALLAAHEGSR
jgi:hypothetical protein